MFCFIHNRWLHCLLRISLRRKVLLCLLQVHFLLVLQVHFSRSTFTFIWEAFCRVTFTFTQVQNKCTCYSSVAWSWVTWSSGPTTCILCFRPVAGFANFCPKDTLFHDTQHQRQQATAVVKHEIIHALVRRQRCVISLVIKFFRRHPKSALLLFYCIIISTLIYCVYISCNILTAQMLSI